MWNTFPSVNEHTKTQASTDLTLLEHGTRDKIQIEFDLNSDVSKVGSFIATLFNFRLHFFKKLETNSIVPFKGCTTSCGSCAFVELNSEYEFWTVSHELWHLLELNSALLIDSISRKLNSQFGDDFKNQKRYLMDYRSFKEKRSKLNPNPPTEQQVNSELIADLNGYIFATPAFWSTLSNKIENYKQQENLNQISQWLSNDAQPTPARQPLNITPELLEDFGTIWHSRLQLSPQSQNSVRRNLFVRRQ